jgi:peptide/nickel transport system substrate-binding protein
MSRTQLVVGLVTAGLALGVLGPASAQTRLGAKYGGTLTVSAGDPATLDPTLVSTGAAIIFPAICERLYDFDARAQVVPQLAAALPAISKDKLTYTIPLRTGILFNDGTPFTAQAVVTTLRRFIDYPGSVRASDLELVDGVTAAGPSTVVIHLKAPFTPLLTTLATSDGIVLSPAQLAKLGDDFGTNPVCVGPFMFDHRVPGDNITVIKSPYYYNQGAVYLDKIVFKPLPSTPAAVAALMAGDVQVLTSLSATELPDVQQDSALKVIQSRALGWNGIRINTGNKNGWGNLPYTNVGTPLARSAKLRQAFEEAIDRATLVRVVYGGTQLPGCTPISPESPWFDPTLKCTPYNPEQAKRLVAASGIPNPTVHLQTSSSPDALNLAQFIQAQEAAVGINVVLDIVDGPTYLARAESGTFDTVLAGSEAINPDPASQIYQWFATSGSRNLGGYSNPRLDLILDNARKAMSLTALKTLYRAAQRILINDRPMIFLTHPRRFAAFTTEVTGVQLNPDFTVRVAFAQFR